MKNILTLFLVILIVASLGIQAGKTSKMKSPEIKKKKETGMAGIVFFKTQKLKELKDFYINQVGARMWMDQKTCIILRFGNFLFGFCQSDKADMDALLTFFYDKKEAVDSAYQHFKKTALAPPVQNKNYPIYNFFARDPEGRMIEFQYFTCPIDWEF